MTASNPSKPGTLKWVKGLSIFQLIVGAAGWVFFLWLFNTDAATSFVEGMQQEVANGFGRDVFYLSSPEGLGFMTGMFIVALLGPVFALIAIARRSKNWAIASLVFNIGAMVIGFSPVTLAAVILMLVKPSRDYLHLSFTK